MYIQYELFSYYKKTEYQSINLSSLIYYTYKFIIIIMIIYIYMFIIHVFSNTCNCCHDEVTITNTI